LAIRNSSGKVSIVVSGIMGSAVILFGLHVWVNMPQSEIQHPAEIGTPLLCLRTLIVAIILIIIIAKAASQ